MKKNPLDQLLSFKNKTVVVTGATGQLGYEICRAYHAEGARVIGLDKKLTRRKMVKAKTVEYRETDVADKGDIKEAFDWVGARHKKIDILINNAGVSVFEPFEERPESSFDLVMDVNLKGTFFCIQNFVKLAKARKQGGSIINIGSIYGVVSPDYRIYTDCARQNSEVYGATKAGIIQMTKYFAAHLAGYNIRVNCVSPGGIFNPESPQGPDFVKNYSYRCPLGRMGKAEDMIGGILFLSSDAASYATGQNLMIDGGLSCW